MLESRSNLHISWRWKNVFTMLPLMIASAFSLLAEAATNSGVRSIPRVIVLTDLGNEPDDAQSLVRFLLYSTDYDIEGMFATTSQFLKDRVMPEELFKRIDAYETVYENLIVHNAAYPEPSLLRQRAAACQPGFGMAAVGDEWASEGSRRIIEAVDRDDPRPLWVLAWGGSNCLAQALWQVSQERTATEVDAFVDKLRVYAISDQDDSGPWLRHQYPNLQVIVSPGADPLFFKHATWRGIAGDHSWHASYSSELFCYLKQWLGFSCGDPAGGPDFDLVDNPWLDKHIRVGSLGALYPQTHFIMEGDSPSFMNLINNGLNADFSPTWGGWGGRYEQATPLGESRPIWTNSDDRVIDHQGQTHVSNHATIWRWREAYQWDFPARMAWTLTDVYAAANHPPQISVDDDITSAPIYRKARPGESIEFGVEINDPDKDDVQLRYWQYFEAGTSPTTILLSRTDKGLKAQIPLDALQGTIHVIVEVHDNGTLPMVSYRRLILSVLGEEEVPQSDNP